MTAIDELADLVRTIGRDAGRRSSHRPARRGSGLRGRHRQGAHHRPQPARRDDRGPLRRRPRRAGDRRRQRPRRRPRRARRRHRRVAPLPGPTMPSTPVTSSSPSPPAATSVARPGARSRPPRPASAAAGPAHRRRPRAHDAQRRGLLRGARARPLRARRRDQHASAGARLLPRPRRRRARCATRSRRWPKAAVRAGPPRRRARPADVAARLRKSVGLARARWAARPWRCRGLARGDGRHPEGDLLVKAAIATSHLATTCSPRSAASSRAVSWRSRWCAAPRS